MDSGLQHFSLPFFILLCCLFQATAEDGSWKIATATLSRDKDGSSSVTTGGACGYGDLRQSSYGGYSAGLSGKLFNRGSSCGACLEVRCVNHIRWCLQGSPSVVVTATDFCPPNSGLSSDYGGWCNFPKEHLELSHAAFTGIAETRAEIIPVQYRRVLISNVGLDGEVVGVKVKGHTTAWIPMARNWGQNWHSSLDLIGQSLSFEVTLIGGKTIASYDVAPPYWRFGMTYQGKQFLS
ncbi:Expansin-A20 [Raphanus sativus]|nr:Expansin-A20 [Raphanus sativus]